MITQDIQINWDKEFQQLRKLRKETLIKDIYSKEDPKDLKYLKYRYQDKYDELKYEISEFEHDLSKVREKYYLLEQEIGIINRTLKRLRDKANDN